MFSGIVETTSTVRSTQADAALVRITLDRPQTFDDIKIGDSVAVNGVCLTLEMFTSTTMTFALGPETLKITGWSAEGVKERVVNLERSLRLSDRVHGHLVTGHVDAGAQIIQIERKGETQWMVLETPDGLRPYIWYKGSVTLDGVSLTVNQAESGKFQVGLIPETLKRTNLGLLKPGARVNLEIDNTARGLVHWAKFQGDK